MASDLKLIIQLATKQIVYVKSRMNKEKTPALVAYCQGYEDGMTMIRDAMIELEKVVSK